MERGNANASLFSVVVSFIAFSWLALVEGVVEEAAVVPLPPVVLLLVLRLLVTPLPVVAKLLLQVVAAVLVLELLLAPQAVEVAAALVVHFLLPLSSECRPCRRFCAASRQPLLVAGTIQEGRLGGRQASSEPSCGSRLIDC